VKVPQKSSDGASLWEEKATLDCLITKNRPEVGMQRAGRIIHHLQSEYRLLHTHPEHEWTVDELAQAVGLARSTLAQRFREIMGESPMRYLAGWRMQVAQHLLRQTSLSMIEVAEQTGYESEAAFSRAFKRYCGQPPAMWRMESW
jgi:transcriptional regulator GlxA family with amidase domain